MLSTRQSAEPNNSYPVDNYVHKCYDGIMHSDRYADCPIEDGPRVLENTVGATPPLGALSFEDRLRERARLSGWPTGGVAGNGCARRRTALPDGGYRRA